jgi:[acyl-carrier-protein] S-malonyltransferase
VTQPAIFIHSTIAAINVGGSFAPDMVAGHSLGEFSALVANKALSFEDGLKLVSKRAQAMQKACEETPSTMAAIIGMEDKAIDDICNEINEVVVPANYNCPGQVVISGSANGIEKASRALEQAGARKVIPLNVGGAFHSPLMEAAKVKLENAIDSTEFSIPICPVFQNVNALGTTDTIEIKKNLIDQLTSPVNWTQTLQNMIQSGATSFTEVGPGAVLLGLVRKIDRGIITDNLS